MAVAFVTGGTGFVGRNLIERLVADRWTVVALHRKTSDIDALKNLNIKLVEGSITDLPSLEKEMPATVDAVFHVAGNTNLWSLRNQRQTKENVDGTRNMVTASIRCGAGRFIHTSTIAAYGQHAERISEETPSTAAESWINYLRTKRLAELEVLEGIKNGLDAVIVNPGNIIGPYDRRNWGGLIRRIASGKLQGLPPGQSTFCHVRDVVQAHISAFHRGQTGHHYLLGGEDASFIELGQKVGEMLNCQVPKKTTPVWLLRIIARVGEWVSYVTKKAPPITPEQAALGAGKFLCNSDKAVEELGYQPARLDEMLQDCITWLRNEKLL